MAESILVTGKKISSMELVTNVTGNEKIPTGQPDDLAVTPNQIADHTIARGDLASQEDLSQVEVSLGTQIADLESDVTSADNSIRGLIAAEEAARIAADNLKVDKEGSVSSVAGRVGDVVLAPSDVLVEGFGSQEDVNKYVAKPFLSGYSYGLGERVVLPSGEVVKSVINGNMSDPNISMVGWVSVISDSLSGTVQTFTTPEAGVDPVTGVAEGAYFNVRSSGDESYADEYQNVGGVPTPSGESYPSSTALNNVMEQVAVNADLLMPVKTPLASSINRTLYDHVTDQVNVKDYGAIGDGTLHMVQEWIDSGNFSSLADIKTEYPHVASLTDSVDWAAVQLCINMRKNVYAPSGTYVFNKSVDTPHSGSPNRVDSSAHVFGDGCKTIFTRNAVTEPATRFLKPDGTLDIDAMDDINNAEAVFAIHGCYYKFTDFMIQHGRVGFYFGQDLRNLAEKSACYKNIIRDVQIRRCGTGIIMSSAYGNHYNDISNIHFIENQIDCEMRTGTRSVRTIANNNRNYFTNIRSNRAIVGLWCTSGDTNRFTCWDGEGCGASPTNNSYPIPVGLPKLANGVTQITNAVHIFDGSGQLNKVLNCQMEGCDIELYNNQFRNSFVMNGYHEAVANGTQVYNLQNPGVFISHLTVFTPNFCRLFNRNYNAFPNVTELGFYVGTGSLQNVTGIERLKETPTSKNYSDRRVFDLGAAAAGSTKRVTIWQDVDPSSSANIKVKVSALSAASNQSFANEMAVTAYRTGTKTLSRYFMQELYKLRATGQGAGGSDSVIVPTIAHGGETTRELVLDLKMPAYVMDSVFVEVEIAVSKA